MLLTPVDQSVVAHLTVEVNGDNRLGVGRPRRFKTGEVNAPVVGLNIHENGCCSRQRDAGRRGNVGHRGDEHLVARPNVEQAERCPKRDRTALAWRALNGVAVDRKFSTERLALRSFDPVQRIQRREGRCSHLIVPRRSCHRNAFHASACFSSSLSVRFHRPPHRAFEDPFRCSAIHGVN